MIQVMTDMRRKVDAIVDKYEGRLDSLVAMLQDVQSEYRYVPEEAIRRVAQRLNLPVIQVLGVVTFFKGFSLKPRGEHIINVCLGTACHVRGAQYVVDEFSRQLGIKPGETTEDMRFTLETVNCLGACALGPIVAVHGEHYGKVTPGKVKDVLKKYMKTPKGKKHEKAVVGD